MWQMTLPLTVLVLLAALGTTESSSSSQSKTLQPTDPKSPLIQQSSRRSSQSRILTHSVSSPAQRSSETESPRASQPQTPTRPSRRWHPLRTNRVRSFPNFDQQQQQQPPASPTGPLQSPTRHRLRPLPQMSVDQIAASFQMLRTHIAESNRRNGFDTILDDGANPALTEMHNLVQAQLGPFSDMGRYSAAESARLVPVEFRQHFPADFVQEYLGSPPKFSINDTPRSGPIRARTYLATVGKDECPVCLHDLLDGMTAVTSCPHDPQHCFCINCMRQAFASSHSMKERCPVCRQPWKHVD